MFVWMFIGVLRLSRSNTTCLLIKCFLMIYGSYAGVTPPSLVYGRLPITCNVSEKVVSDKCLCFSEWFSDIF